MTNENEAVQLMDVGSLAQLTRAEIDQQVATAKRWPRDIVQFEKRAQQLATRPDVAEECTYALPRKDKSGATKNIEGPSVRFAEIVASEWGNCRAGARVVAEEKDFIVAQGAFHDLERNVAITFEVKRRITNSFGKRYSADMIGTTGNAAASIALRNAILRGVPKAFWQKSWDESRRVTLGDAATLDTRRLKAIAYLCKMGTTQDQILATLGVKTITEVTLEHLGTLKGIAQAIRDGDTTVEQAFAPVPAQTNVEEPLREPGDEPKVESETSEPPAEPKPEKVEKPKGTPKPPPLKRVEEPKPEAPAEPVNLQAPPPKGETPAAVESASTGTTPVMLPWEASTLSDNPLIPSGTVLLGAIGQPHRTWDGKQWNTPRDQAAVEAYAMNEMRRTLMVAFKEARLDRVASLEWCKTTLVLSAPPRDLKALTLQQLVALVSAVESGTNLTS
jgi:hypothetical protein